MAGTDRGVYEFLYCISVNSLINSIGIIMDGNRRWAKARGLPAYEGHRAGFEVIKELSREIPRLRRNYGLEYVTVYALSTENWKRSKEELGYLIALFEEGFRLAVSDAVEKGNKNPGEGMRLRIIGERERFSPVLQELMNDAEEKTKDFGGGTVVFALSYGGRAEIVAAAEKLRANGEAISEEMFPGAMWSSGIPDPDIIIRTGGEMRLSNFLPWQSVYSELFFTETLWPDFTVAELEKIFEEYYGRERRNGA
jgi:undecaprenyl diphosphate synthase